MELRDTGSLLFGRIAKRSVGDGRIMRFSEGWFSNGVVFSFWRHSVADRGSTSILSDEAKFSTARLV